MRLTDADKRKQKNGFKDQDWKTKYGDQFGTQKMEVILKNAGLADLKGGFIYSAGLSLPECTRTVK